MGRIDENTAVPMRIVAILLVLGTGGAAWATKISLDLGNLKDAIARIEKRLDTSNVAGVPHPKPNQATD